MPAPATRFGIPCSSWADAGARPHGFKTEEILASISGCSVPVRGQSDDHPVPQIVGREAQRPPLILSRSVLAVLAQVSGNHSARARALAGQPADVHQVCAAYAAWLASAHGLPSCSSVPGWAAPWPARSRSPAAPGRTRQRRPCPASMFIQEYSGPAHHPPRPVSAAPTRDIRLCDHPLLRRAGRLDVRATVVRPDSPSVAARPGRAARHLPRPVASQRGRPVRSPAGPCNRPGPTAAAR
jgi:hypothetical protein